jgi:hypothetical protein
VAWELSTITSSSLAPGAAIARSVATTDRQGGWVVDPAVDKAQDERGKAPRVSHPGASPNRQPIGVLSSRIVDAVLMFPSVIVHRPALNVTFSG